MSQKSQLSLCPQAKWVLSEFRTIEADLKTARPNIAPSRIEMLARALENLRFDDSHMQIFAEWLAIISAVGRPRDPKLTTGASANLGIRMAELSTVSPPRPTKFDGGLKAERGV